MGLIFGCSGHHFEETDRERLKKVDGRNYRRLVSVSNPEHPDHEAYQRAMENGEDFEPMSYREVVETFTLRIKVLKKCKHDGCGKKKWETQRISFEDEEKAKEKVWELVRP